MNEYTKKYGDAIYNHIDGISEIKLPSNSEISAIFGIFYRKEFEPVNYINFSHYSDSQYVPDTLSGEFEDDLIFVKSGRGEVTSITLNL